MTTTASPIPITEPIPLETDTNGVIRVSKTRVTLDTVVAAFNAGATAEEIAQQYPSVPLPDIYYVVGYYLRRYAEVEVYLARRKAQAEQVRTLNQTRFDPQGVRARLVARQATSGG